MKIIQIYLNSIIRPSKLLRLLKRVNQNKILLLYFLSTQTLSTRYYFKVKFEFVEHQTLTLIAGKCILNSAINFIEIYACVRYQDCEIIKYNGCLMAWFDLINHYSSSAN